MERILTDDGLFAAGNPLTSTPGSMVTSVWLNNVQEEIASVIEGAEIELDGASRSQMLDAMRLIAVKTIGLTVVSTTPEEEGPPLVFVLDRWHWATWVETAFYTGYRSLNCGDWYIGSMSSSPRPHEIDGIGGIYDIADHPSLWAWANEQGYVVDAGDWQPKWTRYAKIGTDQFRVPDYRDLFPRVAGTDVDTANGMGPGMYQADALQNITGSFNARFYSNYAQAQSTGVFVGGTNSNNQTTPSGSGEGSASITFNASRVARTSTETRSASARVAAGILI